MRRWAHKTEIRHGHPGDRSARRVLLRGCAKRKPALTEGTTGRRRNRRGAGESGMETHVGLTETDNTRRHTIESQAPSPKQKGHNRVPSPQPCAAHRGPSPTATGQTVRKPHLEGHDLCVGRDLYFPAQPVADGVAKSAGRLWDWGQYTSSTYAWGTRDDAGVKCAQGNRKNLVLHSLRREEQRGGG